MFKLIPRRLALIAALVTSSLVPAGTAQAKCSYTRIAPQSALEVKRAERSTLCLVNHERRKRGRKALRSQKALRVASAVQGIDMLRFGYFAHSRKGWTSPRQRIEKSGYTAGARKWKGGENIASGAIGFATPRSIVDEWLRSRSHKRNMLAKAYRHTGLVVVRWEGSVDTGQGTPTTDTGGDGATSPDSGATDGSGGTTGSGGTESGGSGGSQDPTVDPVTGLILTLDDTLAGLLGDQLDPVTAPITGASTAAAKQPGGVFAGRGPVLVMVQTFGRKWKR